MAGDDRAKPGISREHEVLPRYTDEDALGAGMMRRSPDIEGTRSVTEIHCGIVVGNKEEK